MKLGNIKSRLQTITGATSSEVAAVLVVLSGLIIGLAVRNSNVNDSLASSKVSEDVIFQSLDSLAEAQRTTFIGTDIENMPDSSLAKADTVVEKPVFLGSHLPSKKESFSGVVNLNTASKVQLMKIPGVGEKTAMAIIEYRKDRKFTSIAEIMNIKGIGEKKFEKMKKNITVR